MFLATFILLIVTILLLLYQFFKKSYQFFENARIPYIKPKMFFGNLQDVILFKKPLIIGHKDIYDQLEPHRFGGMYLVHMPSVMIRDPELIKTILVKDFYNFHDHGVSSNSDVEPLGKNLFGMSGDEWKNLRIKLTGTFTSGKMKMMFPLVKQCGENIKSALSKTLSDDAFDVKDLYARYTTDVIGSCAFGIETHSLEDPNSQFRTMGKRILKFRWQGILRTFFPNLPKILVKHFGLTFFEKEIGDYFEKLIEDMVKYREENNITRGDFLDLLIAMKNHKELQKSKDKNDDIELTKFMSEIGEKYIKNDVEMTTKLMAAQCFLFFVGGFDTASSALCFLLYELAQNPDIQTKIRNEILTVLKTNDGELTYDMMKLFTYLNMTITETLRKYPPGGFLMRKCAQNYKIPDSDAILKEGTALIIPVYALHHDKKYYQKPEQFYPEHFTEEEKSKRPHFAYIPFGEGPRMCIAERFAKMEVIVGAIYSLKHFTFEISPKMKLPIEFAPNFGSLMVKDGIWLKCKPL